MSEDSLIDRMIEEAAESKAKLLTVSEREIKIGISFDKSNVTFKLSAPNLRPVQRSFELSGSPGGKAYAFPIKMRAMLIPMLYDFYKLNKREMESWMLKAL